MNVRKYRWSKTYESAEEELLSLLQHKKITARRVVLDPFDTTEAQQHTTNSYIWCAEGSQKVTVGSQVFSMQPGDTLDIPASSPYAIAAGFSGSAYYTSN